MAETADDVGAAAAPPPPAQGQTPLHRELTSPVGLLHKEWMDTKEKKRKTISEAIGDQLCFNFLGALIDGLPNGKCFDLEHPKRSTNCSCTSDLKEVLTDQKKAMVAAYLHAFAKLDWHAQRQLAMEWIKYGEVAKLTHPNKQEVYLLPGSTEHLICKSSLARLLGWARCVWNKLKRCVQEDQCAPRHGLLGKKSNHSKVEYEIMLRTFFDEVVKLLEPRATQIVRNVAREGDEEELVIRDGDEEFIELPAHVSKRGLYKRFIHDHGWEYNSSARGAISMQPIEGQQQTEVPSIWTFLEFWKKEYPKMWITRPRADICGDCYVFANQSKYKKTQLQQQMAEEGESSSDDDEEEEMTEEQREEAILASEKLILDAADHVEMARKQREYVNTKKDEAFADRNKQNSERSFCFTADYCQNLYVPNFAGEQPGETYYISPVNAFTFGVADNSQRPTTLAAYCYLEDSGKKGGNNVCSMLWQEFQRKNLVPDYDAGNNMPSVTHLPAKEINIVLDNCGGQNKNRMLFRMLFLW
jgi:hypothetical protein